MDTGYEEQKSYSGGILPSTMYLSLKEGFAEHVLSFSIEKL